MLRKPTRLPSFLPKLLIFLLAGLTGSLGGCIIVPHGWWEQAGLSQSSSQSCSSILPWYCHSSETNPQTQGFRDDFEKRFPKPIWWDRVSVGEVEIRSYTELMNIWRNYANRAPNVFFKAAYLAILNYPTDDDLVINAIALMPYGDPAYPQMPELLEYGMANYFDYQRPLVNYQGKSGDTIAGIARKLGSIYLSQGRFDDAITLFDTLLSQRQGEINDQLLELITLEYATALFESGQKTEAVLLLTQAIENYEGDWEEKLQEKLSEYES